MQTQTKTQKNRRYYPNLVKLLREMKYDVKIRHFRRIPYTVTTAMLDGVPVKLDPPLVINRDIPMSEIIEKKLQNIMLARGGKIEATIKTPSGEVHTTEVSCYYKDMYDRRYGVNLAMNELIKKLDKNTRIEIFQQAYNKQNQE